jgi:hypothetical protein
MIEACTWSIDAMISGEKNRGTYRNLVAAAFFKPQILQELPWK